MTCGEFLARHSDYLDEQLGAEDSAGMRLHMSACARCARYDRVLRRGLELFRESEPIAPSTDAYVGLQRHLARSRGLVAAPVDAPDGGAPRTPIAASVAVAGLVALVAWSALFRATGVPAPATAAIPSGRVAAEPVSQAAVAGLDLVHVQRTAGRAHPWLRPALPNATTGLPAARPVLAVPGPYSPLLLEPPDYGQAAGASVLASYTR